MEIFSDLGVRIAERWGKTAYRLEAFPDLAARELERSAMHRATDFRAPLAWVTSTDVLTPQVNLDASFGEPPLTMFWHPQFYIQALYWCTSTTSIHGHGFSGAFQVLTGTSLQSLFTFESASPEGQRVRLGQLRQTEAKLLRPGTTQPILAGEEFVHSVFHLGYPSVTIVVRTFGAPPGQVQYSYYRPGVAVEHGHGFDHLTRRLLQIARLQATLQDDGLRATVAAIASKCDLSAAFALLQDLQPLLYAQRRVHVVTEMILALSSRHGLKAIGKMAEAVQLQRSLDPLRRARESVVEDDIRLFLALLLTQQNRRFVMEQVTDYTGDAEPHARIASWIRTLAERHVLNVPSDERVEQFLGRWLDNGRPVAAPDEGWSDVEVTETVERMKRESLLAPLLFEDAAA